MRIAGPYEVAELISLAGGELIGRTRLQKSACVLELTGLGYGFPFAYHLFGPFSEEVVLATSDAVALDLIAEDQRTAAWGGQYSIFRSERTEPRHRDRKDQGSASARRALLAIASKADAIELELAVTAAFFASKGMDRPWDELRVRKPSKASPERIRNAKALYARLAEVEVPKQLPQIP